MTEEKDLLRLKWGTFKGINVVTEEVRAAWMAYENCGRHSMSTMLQHDTAEQKQLLCALIDAVHKNGGQLYLDWSGEYVDAEEAKKYVMTYGD